MLVLAFVVCMSVLSCQSKQLHLEANTAKQRPPDRLKVQSQTQEPKQIWGHGPGIVHIASMDDVVKDERYVTIPKLPVLKNLMIRDDAGFVQNGLSEKELQTKMEGYVNTLKLKEVTYRSWKEKNLDNKVTTIDAESGNIAINVDTSGGSYISFDYNIQGSTYKTKDEFLQLMEDALEKYRYLIPLKNPTLNAMCDAFEGGKLNCGSSIFEKNNDVRQEFISQYVQAYSISHMASDKDIRDSLSFEEHRVEPSKDFELIGQAQATRRLLDGNYYSNVGDVGKIDEANIAKVTLEYRTLRPSGTYVYPFYVFYIETLKMDSATMFPNAKPYQLCYVPALGYEDLKAFQDKEGNLQ